MNIFHIIDQFWAMENRLKDSTIWPQPIYEGMPLRSICDLRSRNYCIIQAINDAIPSIAWKTLKLSLLHLQAKKAHTQILWDNNLHCCSIFAQNEQNVVDAVDSVSVTDVSNENIWLFPPFGWGITWDI